jgi:succinylglutamic semialdehyde dehydrogenase
MTAHADAFLASPPADLVGDDTRPLDGGDIRSHNPARPDETVWMGAPALKHVREAVGAAREALPHWARAPMEKRIEVLRNYQQRLKDRADDFARLISLETGKALWDAKQEAGILAGKIDITLDTASNSGISRVTGFETPISDTRTGVCSFRPHGVMAVVGPYNFPAHLPNGHIAPALAMGNTIVFKPSDKAPAVGQLLGETLRDALADCGMPRSIVNVIQGAAETASSLVGHPGVGGILFTGSWPVGRKILEANLDNPGRIVALEMGGNNAAVVMDDADLRQAVIECARCAFISTGQRCTCTRRIIVHEAIADRFLDALCNAARGATVGDPQGEPQPFLGPLIREDARTAVLSFVADAIDAGAEALVEPQTLEIDGCAGGHFISPGVLKVGRFTAAGEDPRRDAGCDLEVFGPVVRVTVVANLDEAIEQVNATRYGLAASIFTRSQANIDRFLFEAKAGCVNVNAGTAGASSKLPFGGLGHSGNHRPAGAYSLDYCAYPVASMVERGGAAIVPTGLPIDDAWFR